MQVEDIATEYELLNSELKIIEENIKILFELVENLSKNIV